MFFMFSRFVATLFIDAQGVIVDRDENVCITLG